MRTKSLVLLILALGCGLVASIGISQVIQSNRQAVGSVIESEEVVVALKEIKPGDKIKPDMIGLESRAKLTIPDGAYRKLDEVIKAGLPIKTTVVKGEVLLESKFKAASDIVSRSIPNGFRAFSISADNVSGAGGLLNPEDRVDVMFYYAGNGPQQESIAKTILFNIKVFSVNNNWQNGPEKQDEGAATKYVTLLVTPEQATTLGFCQERGKLKLSLRPQNEVTPNDKDLDIAKLQDILRGRNGDRVNNADAEDKALGSGKAVEKISSLGTGFLDLMKSAKEAQPKQTTNLAAAPLPEVDTFQMLILEGSQERAVEFTKAKAANAKWQNTQLNNPHGGPASPAAVPQLNPIPAENPEGNPPAAANSSSASSPRNAASGLNSL